MKIYKHKNFTKTFRFEPFGLRATFGIELNNLHSGNRGFSLFLGNLFVWHQAWFGGELNQVSWFCGKYSIRFPFLGIKYSLKEGWNKY